MRACDSLPAFLPPAESRSNNMRAIKSRGNRTTERRLRGLLARERVRGWTLKTPAAIGSPDFVFLRARVAVFVDGCFWHGCPRCGHVPKTNSAYWIAKIARNQRRDRRIRRAAHTAGYKVVRIWECALKREPALCVERISRIVARRASC